jgi:hypothetical protein
MRAKNSIERMNRILSGGGVVVFMLAAIFAAATPRIVEATQLFTYTGDVLPSLDGWTIKNYPAYESTGAHIESGVLHFTDFYTYGGSCIHYMRQWQVNPSEINVAEFDIKGVSCSSYAGIYFGTSDGQYNMLYTIYPNRIASSAGFLGGDNPNYTYSFDTTTQFNTYKAVIEAGTARLYINGGLVLEQPANPGIYNVKGIEFGAGSSAATGQAYFDEIRAFAVPEPATLLLFGFGGLALIRKHRV